MRKNIVWLTLDSVRADHTTMGGYERNTTPNLQRIADLPDGEYLSKCIATGNGTPTSTASILTGTYPSRHGFKMTNDYLPEQLSTIPELLRDQGFTTLGLSRNSYLSSGSGMDRGFDRFQWVSGSNFFSKVGVSTVFKYLLNIRKHSAGLTLDTAKHATPFILNDVLKRWLSDVKQNKPFFVYAHYNEPHRPYYPPLPYLEQFTDELEVSAKEAADISMDVHHRVREIIADGYALSEQEEEALIAMYDAEIAYTDACIGALFDHLMENDFTDTAFIVTADHGEYFGEHELLGHTLRLDDPVVHVPLVVHGLEEIGHQRGQLVQHIDLMQTLVALAGGPTQQFQGIDLRNDDREFAISQRKSTDFSAFLDINPDFDSNPFHASTLTALRTDEYSFQHSSDKEELFELPDSCQDVSDDNPEVTAELREKLQNWLSSAGQPIIEERGNQFSGAMKRQLRELGYLE